MRSYEKITSLIRRAEHDLKSSGVKDSVKILVEVSIEEYEEFYRELRRIQRKWKDFGPNEYLPNETNYMGHIIRPYIDRIGKNEMERKK